MGITSPFFGATGTLPPNPHKTPRKVHNFLST
jgi:hypothetical protein